MVKPEVHIHLGNKEPLVVGDTVFNSSNVWDLTENELEKACIELGETEDKKQKCLQELKSRLSKEGNYRLDEPYLLRYLRVRKYDCEKAYLNVKNYYNFRKKHPDLYGDPSNYHSLKNYNFFTVLPYADEEGRIVFWADIASWNPREVSFVETLISLAAVAETATMNPKCHVNGVVEIWDMKNLSARHATEALRGNKMMELVYLTTSYVPWRIKKVILMNTGHLTRFLWALCRPMMSQKLRNRVILLGSDYKELHQHVNPAILPKELGGTLGDGLCQDPKLIIDNIPYLEYDRSFTGD